MTEPPISLVGPARERWEALIDSRDWKPTDIARLAAYCASWGRWVTAEQWLANPEHGAVITIRDDKGNIKSHGPAPQLRIAEQAGKEVARLGALLRI